jgi:hypothetical protein
MKERFSKAVQKMKRKDFLDDFIREKTAEEAKLTAEVAELRKKNGKMVGSDIDLQIFQINMRKAEISKLIAKCKAEIKTLKAEILDLLTDCYALAERPENKAKIESACYHAFEGKVTLLSDKTAGGIMGDCEIVGAIITHDKKKKYTTAKLVKAGAKNFLGKVTERPKIIVYDYDKKQEEGIYRDETDEFKKKIGKRKERPTLNFLKETYIQKFSLYSLIIGIISAVFTVWGINGKFGMVYSDLQISLPLTATALMAIFTILTLKSAKKGEIEDQLPLTAILLSLSSLVFAIICREIKSFVFPICFGVYGVTAIVLRTKTRNDRTEEQNKTALFGFAVSVGCFWEITLNKIANALPIHATNYNTVKYIVAGLVIATAILAVVAVVGCFIKRESKQGQIFKYTAIAISVFCLERFLCNAQNPIGLIIFIIGIITGVSAFYKELKSKNV